MTQTKNSLFSYIEISIINDSLLNNNVIEAVISFVSHTTFSHEPCFTSFRDKLNLNKGFYVTRVETGFISFQFITFGAKPLINRCIDLRMKKIDSYKVFLLLLFYFCFMYSFWFCFKQFVLDSNLNGSLLNTAIKILLATFSKSSVPVKSLNHWIKCWMQ